MYQRLGLFEVVAVAVSFIPLTPSDSHAEHEGNSNADQLIRDQEKNRGDRHHNEHHGGRNRGLPTRWPSHLARLIAHLLEKLERRCRHSIQSRSSVVQLFPVTAAFAQAGQLKPDLSLAGMSRLEPATPDFGGRGCK